MRLLNGVDTLWWGSGDGGEGLHAAVALECYIDRGSVSGRFYNAGVGNGDGYLPKFSPWSSSL